MVMHRITTARHDGQKTRARASGLDAAELLTKAVAEENVAFVPGHGFHADGSGRNTMRLSYSLPPLDKITAGIGALAG